jgi:hypothetical protein
VAAARRGDLCKVVQVSLQAPGRGTPCSPAPTCDANLLAPYRGLCGMVEEPVREQMRRLDGVGIEGQERWEYSSTGIVV